MPSSLKHNCGKCWSISKILSLLHSAIYLQKDPCYVSHCTLTTSPHYLAKRPLQTHSTFSKLLMVFMGMSKLSKTNLVFVDHGVKITGTSQSWHFFGAAILIYAHFGLKVNGKILPFSDLFRKFHKDIYTLSKQEVKVIWQKAPHFIRLGVTPGGRKLYHWIPGVGFPISVP